MRILLVEDEAELARWLAQALARHAGFVIEWANDGLVAERRIQMEEFDAIVLDLGLPGLDGRSLLGKMRARSDDTPVLILTARDSLGERVATLRDGADDFLAKPFNVEELEVRLQALIRRSRGRSQGRVSCGELVFDPAAQKFSAHGQALALSPREHAVLRTLAYRIGEPMTKQQILDRVFSGDADINLEAVEVLIHRLRKKLGGTGTQIVTLRGLGYCLEATP